MDIIDVRFSNATNIQAVLEKVQQWCKTQKHPKGKIMSASRIYTKDTRIRMSILNDIGYHLCENDTSRYNVRLIDYVPHLVWIDSKAEYQTMVQKDEKGNIIKTFKGNWIKTDFTDTIMNHKKIVQSCTFENAWKMCIEFNYEKDDFSKFIVFNRK